MEARRQRSAVTLVVEYSQTNGKPQRLSHLIQLSASFNPRTSSHGTKFLIELDNSGNPRWRDRSIQYRSDEGRRYCDRFEEGLERSLDCLETRDFEVSASRSSGSRRVQAHFARF